MDPVKVWSSDAPSASHREAFPGHSLLKLDRKCPVKATVKFTPEHVFDPIPSSAAENCICTYFPSLIHKLIKSDR